jgi:hypothetical protein
MRCRLQPDFFAAFGERFPTLHGLTTNLIKKRCARPRRPAWNLSPRSAID